MRRHARIYAVAVGTLVILLGLYLNAAHLETEREKQLSQLTGNDEMTQILRTEAEDFRIMNRYQKLGFAASMVAVVVVVLAWSFSTRIRSRQGIRGPDPEASDGVEAPTDDRN